MWDQYDREDDILIPSCSTPDGRSDPPLLYLSQVVLGLLHAAITEVVLNFKSCTHLVTQITTSVPNTPTNYVL
jgi:hypothetical protein